MTYEEATKFLKNVITYPQKPNEDSKYPNYWIAEFTEVLALLEEQAEALRLSNGEGMTKSQIALLAIKRRVVYDLKLNSYVWVNKLIYWKDELMISGYAVHYRVADYGKTWKLSVDEEYEQRQALNKDFEEWLNLTKLNKKYKNGKNTEEK